MGEIADMMINGDMDFYTGEYIGKGHGMPRTLDGSLDWEHSEGRRDTIQSVAVWLGRNRKKITYAGNAHGLTYEYCVNKLKMPQHTRKDERLIVVEQDFIKFANWVMHTYKK